MYIYVYAVAYYMYILGPVYKQERDNLISYLDVMWSYHLILRS